MLAILDLCMIPPQLIRPTSAHKNKNLIILTTERICIFITLVKIVGQDSCAIKLPALQKQKPLLLDINGQR